MASKAPKKDITADEAAQLLSYDPATGEFTWKARLHGPQAWNTRFAGQRAGYRWRPRGSAVWYRCIRIYDWPQLEHRLAILLTTGAWPPECVDHIDGNGENNRLANLRLANRKQNAQNAGAKKNSSTGVRGVSPYNGRYRAAFNGVALGVYDTIEEARAVYTASARLMHGEFVKDTP